MTRAITYLKQGWKFTREPVAAGAARECDTSDWQAVRVPHDWAIAGPFDRECDIQRLPWKQDDVPDGGNAVTGRTAGLPHVGQAWYRLDLDIPESAEGKRFRIEFDGVMSHSTVYCNGEKVGSWPFGYASFAFDITGFVRPGGDNVIAVHVDNPDTSSRWYPGAGIFRHVRLVELDQVHVGHWGTYITTPEITEQSGKVRIRTTIENHSDGTDVSIRTVIKAPDGSVAVTAEQTEFVSDSHTYEQSLAVASPQFWSLTDRAMYAAVVSVFVDDSCVDEMETKFGFRTLRCDAEQGFFLNGKNMKLNGVCMHHDHGALGAAFSVVAMKRQLTILQEMGCNAIRTSHNPPAPELLDLADEMGFLIIDEAFDEWKYAKVSNGYHTLFEEWAEKDLRALIKRDRNHPSVIMWSLGNELAEQHKADGGDICQYLSDIAHDEDLTRPTTAGFNHPKGAIENGLAAAVDIPGWNYEACNYVKWHQLVGGKPTYGSETESTVSSRGEYYFPVFDEPQYKRETLHVNSFDRSFPNWGYSPDVEFRAQDECPFSLGEFVWTGFDYLGEPTPYTYEWPSRSSYFGIIDLCGFPKDRYYLYQSKWSDKDVLHLLPHWTWPSREGEVLSVHCYTSHQTVELFVNGVSQGKRTKRDKNASLNRYRLVWDSVIYQPGELKAVAYDRDGNVAVEEVVHTAGAATKIEMRAERAELHADGDDLAFVSVSLVDADGNFCPTADNRIEFAVEGPADLVATDNGDQTSLESFASSSRKLFNGRCLVYLRTREGECGTVTLTASSQGLSSAQATLEVTGGK